MSSKWNEKLVTSFLKVYKQHPCLWNPYHKDYYNCREKHKALQKIIDDIGTPGFTVTDYLQQIKIIREKYKREQLRTLKGLESQKRYISPFPWYNIVADMLMKVIDNEKTNSGTILIAKRPDTSVLKSLSSDNVRNSRKREAEVPRIHPYTNATCDEIARSKSARSSVKSNSTSNKTKETRSTTRTKYVPCPQARTLRGVSKDREKNTLLNQRPTRDIESRAMGYPMTTPYTSIDLTTNNITGEHNKNYEPPFLQCPLCGWEDAKYKQIERNAVEPVMKQINFVPCSDYYRDLPHGKYTPCSGCDKDIIRRSDYTKKHTDDSRDFDILKDPDLTSKRPEMAAEFYREPYHVRSIVKPKKDVDVVKSDDEATKVTKDGACVREPVQTQIVQYDPMANKFLGVTVEAYTWLKIIPSDLKKNVDGATFATQSVCQSTQGVQCTKSKLYTKETQLSSKTVSLETNDASVNTVNYVEQEAQNTICVPNRLRRCVSLQTLNQIDEKEKRENKHCVTNSICTTKCKGVAINTVNRVSKGIQSTICMSRGNLARSLSFDRMKDVGTTLSFQEIHNNICVDATYFKKHDANLVRHVGIDVQCVSVTQMKSHESINHCIRRADLKEPMERETEEFETPCKSDTCPRNICEIIKDPTVAFTLQQVLYKMLSYRLESGSQSTKTSSLKISNMQTDHKSTCNAKTNCRITATEMVDKIKEFTIRTLGSGATSRSKDELKQTHAVAEALSSNITKPTMIEESDFEPVFESTKIIDGTKRIFADDMILLKGAKKFPSVDKEVSVYSESRDVGTNGSFSQLPVRNIGVQNGVQLESFVSTNKPEMDKRKKVSVGTQKRDPILIRVIKCNESQTIAKSDKETLTAAIDIGLEKKYIDKRVETCGRLTCLPYTVCRKLEGENLESVYQKKCKCQIDSDYRQQPYKNYMCDKNCKDKVRCDQDWTDITNIDAFRNLNNSKIPLCVRPRKCTYTSQ